MPDKLCACGCGAPVRRQWKPGHYARVHPQPQLKRLVGADNPRWNADLHVEKLCGCGCGALVRRRFKPGHGSRVNPPGLGKRLFGADNPNWKGGLARRVDGRIGVYSPGHPHAELVGKGKTPYVFRYRLVIEDKIGRHLKKGEVVHHRDEDPTHDADDNLELLPSQREHARIHADKQRDPRTGRLR
jgi:HNH endonuclease